MASSARPLPTFDYPLVHEGEPSHWPEGILSPLSPAGRDTVPSPHGTWSGSLVDRSEWPHARQLRRRAAMEPTCRPAQGATTGSTIASTPYATHSKRTAWLEEQELTSRPRGENSGRHRLNPERRTHRNHTRRLPPRGMRGLE